MNRIVEWVTSAPIAILVIVVVVVAYGDVWLNADSGTVESAMPEDVIAMVGDQPVTYSELSTMMNSSAMVGLSIPALGTPERNQALVTLLDKAISANLLYLDARAKGVDRLTSYIGDIEEFEKAILAMLYRNKHLIGDLAVTEEEIQQYYDFQAEQNVELSDTQKDAIVSKLRKQKYNERKATMRERLREGVAVRVRGEVLDPAYDDDRKNADIVATVDDYRISWNQVGEMMQGADKRADASTFYIDSDEERLKRLDMYIDNMIMARKARQAGLEQDPSYISRSAEFRKTRLVTMHRSRLIENWKPTEDELKDYYVENMDEIAVPEMRKLQMVVLGSKQEAEAIRKQIVDGEITMFQAARDHSIDPNAKSTLGELGWVSEGSGFDELDSFTFNLDPEVVSEPVESPAGWHLVKVLDVVDAQKDNFDEAQARRTALRLYMQAKFNDYVVGLRKNDFEVAVYDDVLGTNFRKEAEFIAELSRKASEKGSVTEQRQQKLKEIITSPGNNG